MGNGKNIYSCHDSGGINIFLSPTTSQYLTVIEFRDCHLKGAQLKNKQHHYKEKA
jgi:hypothetical protein